MASDRALGATLGQIRRRIAMLAARAVVRLVSDGSRRQLMQLEVLAGELRDGIERMQDYGLTSHPHAGADAAVVFLGGNREQGIVLAVDDRRYRVTGLQPGEVVLYDDLGNRVELRRGRMLVKAVDHLQIEAPTITIVGDVEVTGALRNNGIDVGSSHRHSGVDPGSGTSGGPVS